MWRKSRKAVAFDPSRKTPMRLAACFMLLLATAASAAESVYTEAEKGCLDIGDKRAEQQGVMLRCKGPAGYAVVFTDEGNVVDARFGPRGREKNIGGLQWTGAIDAKKVEWRMEDGHPVAAIFRISKMNPETSESRLYLAVAKVTAKGGCLIDLVDARATDANSNARNVADTRAGAHSCAK
jgi:hypothetical protein